MCTENKNQPELDFNPEKIPLELLLKYSSKIIGRLKTDIGILKSDIEELKDKNKRLMNDPSYRKEIKKEEVYKNLQTQIDFLNAKKNKLKKDYDNLLTKCVQSYNIDVKEKEAADKFIEIHDIYCPKKPLKYSYIFTSTGIGNSVEIRCNSCGAVKNITNVSKW